MHSQNYNSDQSEFLFDGNYRGFVINNQDPYQGGRCQIRILSVYDNVPDELLPWAEYADPFMQGQAGSGGFFVPDVGAKVWCFFEAGDHMQPVYFAGAPAIGDGPPNKNFDDEELPRGEVAYARNRVIRSSGGHLIELDDTPGATRVRVVHKSGTQIVMYENGDLYEQVMGNCKRVVKGNLEEIVNGNVTRQVVGEQTTSVNGEMKFESGGTASFWSAGNVDINGTTLNFNAGAAGVVQVDPFEGFIPSEQVQLTPRNATPLMVDTSSRAAWDEEEEVTPTDWPAPTSEDPVVTPTEINTPPLAPTEFSASCETITTVDYNYQLSPNFNLRQLSLGCVYPHTIKAQNGLTISQIVCNLKHLAINILEPLKAKYPNIRINSGFRSGTSGSQHNKGMACDIQVAGWTGAQYSDAAAWIAANLPFDQFILEHGNSIWFHLSYNPSLSDQRGQKLTYWPRESPNYKAGLKNYYDHGRVIT